MDDQDPNYTPTDELDQHLLAAQAGSLSYNNPTQPTTRSTPEVAPAGVEASHEEGLLSSQLEAAGLFESLDQWESEGLAARMTGTKRAAPDAGYGNPVAPEPERVATPAPKKKKGKYHSFYFSRHFHLAPLPKLTPPLPSNLQQKNRRKIDLIIHSQN